MEAALAHEQRLYRSVLFGQKEAQALPRGSVRIDEDGKTWLKTMGNEWTLAEISDEGDVRTDEEIDDGAEFPARRGIFEIRRTPTSDLIPPILQSLRALQCRLRAVCMIAAASPGSDEQSIDVQPDGCMEQTFPRLSACIDATQVTIGTDSCDSAIAAIIAQESELLKLAVAYDAAYRSLLQFAGIFEGFLHDFTFPILEPIWQAVRVIGQMNGIPCFLSQCDE